MSSVIIKDLIEKSPYIALKNAVSTIIPCGNLLADLVDNAISAPAKQRLNEMLQLILERLTALEKNGEINISDLENNTAFQTSIIQGATIAPRIHQKIKMKALVSAVINSAIAVDIDEDIRYIFIEYINELTPSHLVLLKYFRDNESALKNVKTYEDLYGDFISNAELIIGRDVFKLLCDNLAARYLMEFSPDIENFASVHESSHMAYMRNRVNGPMLRTTDLGKQFLRFISELR